MKYANVIVNISHENLDRPFQYLIPEKLLADVFVGSLVKIPFGKANREIEGYVIEITDKAEFEVSRIKSIDSVVIGAEFVESKMIQLAWWMRETYGSTMINALKVVIPVRKKVREKEHKNIVLKLGKDEALSRLEVYAKKHQTARERLLKELIDENNIDYKLVTGKLNISKTTIDAMVMQEVIEIESKRVYRNTTSGTKEIFKANLNEKQQKIASDIICDYRKGIRSTYLIHGITGSGKTEVYMEVIEQVVKMGKQVIVLIPEIALTFQTVMRFYKRFGDSVSSIHSKLSDGEKYDQFERAKRGEISVMIGPRSALFTPFEKLGLIVIDEEHENSYKSDNMPKYHAVETAKEICRLYNASLILGSATPSVDSYQKALSGEIKLFKLDERARGLNLPTVHVVDLKEELKSGNKSMFSSRLKDLIQDRINKNEQVMLFLNRRGFLGTVSCRECGHVIKCPHCDVSMALHGKSLLKCHYCDFETNMVSACPKCGSKYIGGMRVGTEQIEAKLKEMFPVSRILRMDADTTKHKDDYERILSAFANREADILVGTQMIVKGHDFPYVTLMGIMIADMSLNANDYRAAERTFQLLTQAAGRAGRGELNGEVVIQTYQPEHYSIVAATNQDYESFFEEEIAYRRLMKYPPMGHVLVVMIEGLAEGDVKDYCDYLANTIKNDIIKKCLQKEVRLIGPTEASIYKLRDLYRRVMYIKAANISEIKMIKGVIEDFSEKSKERNLRITLDVDPLNGY